MAVDVLDLGVFQRLNNTSKNKERASNGLGGFLDALITSLL